MWDTISNHITSTTGSFFSIESKYSVAGGSINSAYVIADQERRYFVKTNHASRVQMFHAELEGLTAIAEADAIKVPAPICVGSTDRNAYIVMEYLSIHEGRGASAVGMDRLGQDLARMHRHVSERYGWYRDNTIGSTPQINTQSQHWVEFYRQHRLGYQYQLAIHNGFSQLQDSGELLMSRLDEFFSSYKPVPSLLHGDLWSGNYAIDDEDVPVIFDPAVYYGDREADIAMTELFGGFSNRFYAAYNHYYPLDSGYKTRKILYNLYHILNHANLFGGAYAGQAQRMANQLLSELG